jgi:hypothetical protein
MSQISAVAACVFTRGTEQERTRTVCVDIAGGAGMDLAHE